MISRRGVETGTFNPSNEEAEAGLELRDPLASQVLGLKACATTAWLMHFISNSDR
ncbi:hypothetical protein ACRRTK_020069 [Alexandromys fortis]